MFLDLLTLNFQEYLNSMPLFGMLAAAETANKTWTAEKARHVWQASGKPFRLAKNVA